MSQSNLSHLSVSGQENLLTPAEVAGADLRTSTWPTSFAAVATFLFFSERS